MNELDKLYSSLNARCHECDKHFQSVYSAKVMIDKNGEKTILCLDCAEKYKNEYRMQTEEEIEEGALMAMVALAMILNKDIK